MRYVGGVDERGEAIDVRDPLSGRLKALSDAAADARARAEALLLVAEVFPRPLASDPGFRADVAAALATIEAEGARAAVARIA